MNGISCFSNTESKSKISVNCVAIIGRSIIHCSSSQKTSPRFLRMYEDKRWLATKHAEMGILSKIPVGTNPKRVKIFTSRISEGNLTNSKPCAFCQKHLMRFGILPRNIFYYDWFGNKKKLGSWTFEKELKEDYVDAIE